MKRFFLLFIALSVFLLQGQVSQAQARPKKTKVTFELDSMSVQLLRYLNGNTKAEEKIAENTALVNSFESVFNGLDDKYQQQVVDLYNAARQTKMAPTPDYINLTKTLIAYNSATVSATIFDEWLNATSAILQMTNKKKEITGFIEYTAALLESRTLYRSKSSIWRTQEDSKFTFEVLKNDIRTHFKGKVELTYASGSGKNADENTIHNTTGDYYFLAEAWEGKGGRLLWDRCGVPESACYADLQDYSAQTKLPKFTADSVTFINTNYFKTPIKGSVEEALSDKTEPEKYTFPKFRSYQKDFQIKDVLPGVDFEGNFMMYGARFVTNDEKNPASMIFYRDGKRFLVVSSTKFSVLPHMLTTERGSVKIYIGDDSITNSGVLVRYTTEDQRVNMINSTTTAPTRTATTSSTSIARISTGLLPRMPWSSTWWHKTTPKLLSHLSLTASILSPKAWRCRASTMSARWSASTDT